MSGYATQRLMRHKGFTLVEVLVAMFIVFIFSTLSIYFLFNFWRYSSLLDADLTTFISRLNANDFIREKVGTTSGLINQNSIPDSHTQSADPSIPSNLYWLPIHAIPKNTPATGTGYTPLLYFKRFSTNSSGAYIMNGSQPYEDEYVLYINLTTKELRLRTLANASASGNALKTSCPPASATSSCPEDKVIISDLSSIDTKYFSKSGNTIDYTSSTDPNTGQYNGPDFSAVEVLELNLHIAKKPVFQKTNATINDTVIRIALRNT